MLYMSQVLKTLEPDASSLTGDLRAAPSSSTQMRQLETTPEGTKKHSNISAMQSILSVFIVLGIYNLWSRRA